MPRLRSGLIGSRNLAFQAAVSAVIAIIVFIERGVIGFAFLGFAGLQALMSYVRYRSGA